MKKLLSLVLAVATLAMCAVPVFAADSEPIFSDTTKVNVENTDTAFAKPSSEEYHADSNYYLHYKSTAYYELTRNLSESLVAGEEYTVTMKGKVVSGALHFRVGWDDGTYIGFTAQRKGTDLGDGWKEYTETIKPKANQQTLMLIYDSGEFYLDDISIKSSDGKEYIPNGDFNTVTYVNEKITATGWAVVNTGNTTAEILREAATAENTYSLHYKSDGTTQPVVEQNLTEKATAGEKYVFTAYVKDHTTAGEGNIYFRIGWDNMVAASTVEWNPAAGPDGWVKIEKEVTLSAVGEQLIIAADPNAEVYIDDISLVKVGGTENLVPDGGFGEVTIPIPEEPDAPAEPTGPVLSDTTTVNIENTETRYAELVDTEYHGVPDYSLHYKTTGDWFEAYQSFTETLPAGTYTFTVYAKGEGEAWYYHRNPSGWGAEWAQIKLSDGEDAGNGWKKYVKEITEDGNGDTGFLIHNVGAADIYFDNMSLVDANGKDYISDGGFDNISTSTTNNQGRNSDTMFTKANLEATVADNTYSMHAYTTGDGIEFSQNFSEALPTGTYTLTAYMKGTGAVWYYNRNAGGEWSSEWAKFDLAYGTADADGWCKFTKEFTVSREGNVNFLFSTEGACDFYIDDISLVDANGKNYAVYGGFVVPENPDEPEAPVTKYVVSEPEFTGLTADGKLKAGTVEVKVTITNKEMGDDFDPIMIVTLYDGTELKTFGYLQQTVVETAEGESVPANEFVSSVTVPSDAAATGYSLKVMVWDGLTTLNSLVEPTIID